jgi:hypothetical protein
MLDLVGQGVLLWIPASVVRHVVGVLRLHLAAADAAVDEALEDVRVPRAMRPVRSPGPRPAGERLLGLVEGSLLDQRLMRRFFGLDPPVGAVPAHDWRVAERDVVDVEEDFVRALFVPDLPAGVAGVAEDELPPL